MLIYLRLAVELKLFSLVFCLLVIGACGPDSSDDTDSDAGPEISDEQEKAMCSSLEASTGGIVQAGAAFGEGGAMNPAPGLKSIDLEGSGNNMEGYVELQATDGTVILMLSREDVPMEVLDAQGNEVPDVDFSATSEVCPGAEGRFTWAVLNSNNHLHFGPTSLEEVHIVIEKIE